MIAGSGGPGPQTAGVLAAGTPVPGAAEPGRATISPDLVGSILSDRYRVLRKLGEGGMGSVYLAEHTTINKRLAIKVLSSEYSHKQDLVDRFLQEARAASMIEQENVVEITDFGSTPHGSVFFVMEYLNGEDLSRTIKKEGPLPWSRVKPIMIQICTALAAAHDAGIIHRDMKPENCYRITRGANSDFIKVLDFGIAKVTSDDGDAGGKGLTRTGMIFGTPEYMSPEQAKGERADHRVDIYALGVILYELLTGRVPFTADTFMGILTKHMFEAPPAPSTLMPMATIPADVEAIVLKALQKDREYRFQSMREMMQAIQAVGTGAAPVSVVAEDVMRPLGGETRFSTGIPLAPATEDTTPQRRSSAVVFAVGAVVLAGLGGLGVFLLGGDDSPAPEPAPVAVAGTPDPGEAKVPAAAEEPPTAEKDDGDAAPTPAVATKVKVIVSAPGVEGTVHDERDDALLGKTNEAFDLPFGSESMGLYVRADGYEDQLASVIPDADKTVSVTMAKAVAVATAGEKTPKKTHKRTKKGTKSSSGSATKTTPTPATTDTTPKTEPKPKTPPTSSGSSSSPDLKNPFKKGG